MAALRRGAEVDPRQPRKRAGAGGARPRGVDRSEHRSSLWASAVRSGLTSRRSDGVTLKRKMGIARDHGVGDALERCRCLRSA